MVSCLSFLGGGEREYQWTIRIFISVKYSEN